MSDNKNLKTRLDLYYDKYQKYADSKGISVEQVFYKKYLIYKLKYKKLLNQMEKTAGADNNNSQIGKLLWEQIEPVELNQTNPIARNGDYSLFKNGKTFELIDTQTGLKHSKFDEDTWKNHFIYAQNIVAKYPVNSKKICILGFAIGGLSLELSLNPNVEQIDGVDIDYGMFRLFKSIITSKPSKINYYLNDVNNFIKQTDNKYDMIVDDTYTHDKIIVDYSQIKKILNPGGVLFINVIKFPTVQKLIKELETIFSKVTHQPVNNNWIITCYN